MQVRGDQFMTGPLQRKFSLLSGGSAYNFGIMGDDGYGNQSDSDYHRCGDTFRVAPHELRELVTWRIQARNHGTAFQIAPDVFGELFDGEIAAVRLLAQCHENDVVKVASQLL